MNIPNKITLSRIIIVGMMLIALFALDIVYWVNPFSVPMLGNSGINVIDLVICIVFILGALTDKLDGSLARKWNQVTDLGKFLDPIADKLLVDSLLIYLCLPHFGIALTNPIFMVIPDRISDADAVKMAQEMREKIESTMSYPGTIKVSVIREYRAIETAK